MSELEMTLNNTFMNRVGFHTIQETEQDVKTWVKMVLHLVYEKEYRSLWKKYRVYAALVLVTLCEVIFLNYRYQRYSDSELDALAITVDFGEFVQLQKQSQPDIIEIDEIFGNEFVKDKAKEAEEIKNYKIGVAGNPIMSEWSEPVDLTPNLRPVYPAAARNAGIEGIVMLELVIDKDGSVLRARPVGRKLGYGLEESAVDVYSSLKKFTPSMNNKTGKPEIAKFILSVQYMME